MKQGKEIRVLIVEPGKAPYYKTIKDDLASLQAVVDGYIEFVYPYSDPVALVCNEEGKLINLPKNRALVGDDGEIYDVIAGTFMIVQLGRGEDLVSLDDRLGEKYRSKFARVELY